jgi:hypothetical protein
MAWAFLAEDADTYQDLSRSVERYARPEVVLIHGSTGTRGRRRDTHSVRA